jgi:hypothetical protein
MIRRIIKVLAAVGIFFVLLLVGVWFLIQPPAIEVPSQERLVFSNMTVVNPGLNRQAGQTLTVEDGQIVSITPQSSDSPESEATTRFSSAYVLPGLIDMHAHHPPFSTLEWKLFGLLFLMHGVTTVRDTGAANVRIVETRQQIEDGAYPAPRLFTCGPILDGDPPWPQPWFWSVRNPAEAREAVDKIAEAEVDCVKVYSGLSAETLTAIREAAEWHGLPVIGHIPFAVPFEEARVSDIQHLTGVPATPNRVTTTTAERFAQWLAFLAAGRGLDAARIDFIVRTSVEQGLAHTPTLVASAQWARMRDYSKLLDDPAARLLPRAYREVLWRPQKAWLQFYMDTGEALPKAKEVVRRLYEAGVHIYAGSDDLNPFVVPGASLHQELHILVDAGLTPEEAWVTATRWPGESLGLPKLGTLQEGAPADFLLFREDPTRDLAALSTLEAVVAQGRLYPKSMLDEAFARHRQHFEGWLYDWLSMTLTRLAVALAGGFSSDEK